MFDLPEQCEFAKNYFLKLSGEKFKYCVLIADQRHLQKTKLRTFQEKYTQI